MGTIFEDRSGYVVRTQGGSATKALLRVTGKSEGGDVAMSSIETLFVTEMAIKKGTRNNVAYSLDDHIFLSAAGDSLGSLALQGLVFGAACNGTGSQIDYVTSHGGLRELMAFYNQHKLLGGRQTMPKVEVVYSDQADWDRYTGYVTGVSVTTSDAVSAAMNFSLECYLVP